ncbi:acyl-CoA dehydrogenase family protein [Burkholderia cepacia]|uniref:acyl-CoA dehydrogenase family protein n=1 Tax=Burkholderia cepacia TaxID=292 RepID=UPI0015752A6E|nr:acyl-CoA/acyl-ACP dehydrogenase [Burkholderia cepacia]
MGHVFRTGEQQIAVDGFRRFLDEEIEPWAREFRDRPLPKERLQPIMAQLAAFGIGSGPVRTEHGGLGLDWQTYAMLFEDLAYTCLDLSIVALINTFGAVCLDLLAPPALRERYLPGLISGERFASLAFSEPDVGSNLLEVKTRARLGENGYVINGEKTWISNGRYSDFLICTCRTGADARGGLTYLLVDREQHGYEVRDIHKIALNSQSTAQIFLRDVTVPAANIIGGEGRALANTLALFERSRMIVASQGVGVARRALDEAIAYAQERRQHGKVLAGHQLISAMLADMATRIDAGRLLCNRAAAMMDAGLRAEMEAAMAKSYTTEAAVEICRQAVQIHGGNGLASEFLVEKLAREAIVMTIPEGTTQMQQLIVGRALTGVSAF